MVTADRAAIFVDGRYRLQVQGQVDLGCFTVRRHPGGQARGLADRGAAARRPAGVRPVVAHRQGGRGAGRGARAAADRAGAGGEPDRPGLAGPAAAAGAADRGASAGAGRAVVGGEARRARPRAGGARPRGGGADAAGFDRLAAERPRRATSRGRRCRWPSPSSTPAGGWCSSPTRRSATMALRGASRAGGGGRGARGLRPGARRAARAGRGRPGQRAGLGLRTGWRRAARPRWSGSATPASCPRPARPRRRSPGRARRTCATGRRWRSSWPGST